VTAANGERDDDDDDVDEDNSDSPIVGDRRRRRAENDNCCTDVDGDDDDDIIIDDASGEAGNADGDGVGGVGRSESLKRPRGHNRRNGERDDDGDEVDPHSTNRRSSSCSEVNG
jgi:hypothetical protein